jgi:hypothetical protein
MSKLKYILFGWLIALSVFIMMVFVINFATDFSTYQSILEGNYKIPWYSQNWFKEPYTNFRLMGHEATFYLTTNACRSQVWLVKEIKINDKTFWTTDQRIEITNFTNFVN